LRTAESFKGLQGIKVTGAVRAWTAQGADCEARGEILFTDYGLSGPAILDVSKILYLRGGASDPVRLQLDFLPEYSAAETAMLLRVRRERLAHLSMEEFFTGVLNKKLGQLLSKRAGLEKLSMPVAALTDAQVRRTASQVKNLEVSVSGAHSWDSAQVMAGGASCAQFDPRTMASRLTPGLYAAGEVLDITGVCGGFNLQWAWASGRLAGRCAANKDHGSN
jgi:predicted Rossmann fold flavoprotein